MRTILTTSLLSAAVGLSACGGTGTGAALRKDVTNQMGTIQGAVKTCYHDALFQRSRRLEGTMYVAFRIEAGTGAFKDVQVIRAPFNDPELEQCVVEKVQSLKLAKPQKTTVGVDQFEIRFQPIDPPAA